VRALAGVATVVRRHPGLVAALALLAAIGATTVFAPSLTPYDPLRIDLPSRLQPPSARHWLGTDEFGRDVLSRLLHGGRVTLLTGSLSVALGLVGGIPFGLIAGFSTRLEEWLMRVNDVLLALPGTLVAIAIVAVLGPGMFSPALGVGLSSIPIFARLTRSIVVAVRDLEFVEAARALGVGRGRVAVRHVLPHCTSAILVFSTLYFATAILLVASLSFLGLGIQPPVPEWGAMVSAGRIHMRTAPHLATVPSLAIFSVVLSMNLVGDFVRDMLDPKLRRLL
jgi:ABC-type dipeptide/oligopeptide/nickel transport system permease subunit